ncbi:MAG TPA: hypothetical protein IAB69_03745 [Candidatus Coproplasma excrementigallinarum]|uniref:Uncharacterized protein n=1 Tax=Candidatus Coproplasma excrementigallinarum TaxID=2840747 RepID=A0A9D1MK36_9FIRM|nr:hypothetical protein [Candidatus Coproplasma excrementigallinarum]
MNDKKHNKIKRVLKIIGPIVLVCGLALAITGIVDFGTSAGRGESPTLFWLTFIGLPMTAAGAISTAYTSSTRLPYITSIQNIQKMRCLCNAFLFLLLKFYRLFMWLKIQNRK